MGTTPPKNVSNSKNASGVATTASVVVEDDDDAGGIRNLHPQDKKPPARRIPAGENTIYDPLDDEILQYSQHEGPESNSLDERDVALALDQYLGRGSCSPTTSKACAQANTLSVKGESARDFLRAQKHQSSLYIGSFSSGTSASDSSQDSPLTSPESSPVSDSPLKTRASASQPQVKLPLNSYIRRICTSGFHSKSREFCMTTSEIKEVCQAVSEVFLSQPTLLELGTPVKIVGDIHGQFSDLLRIFQKCGMPPKTSYLFLGDYVDRGKKSLETIMLLFCLKLRYPGNIFLLRGNHECANVTKVYGFYDECKRRSSLKVWRSMVDVFNTLPIAATVGDKIFCVHGGLSPFLTSLKDISTVKRPTDIPENGLISDLLWSDPDPQVKEWSDNDRGVSFCFGRRVLDDFCNKFGFDLVARAHMVVQDGYEFFDKRRLVTIFSAPNYCGDFDNWGAVMSVDKNLTCSFERIEPRATRPRKSSHR